MDGHNTLVANVLTPAGRGAVATIRISDEPDSLAAAVDRIFQSANGKGLLDQPINRICFGHWIADAASEPSSGNSEPSGLRDAQSGTAQSRTPQSNAESNAEEVVLCRTSPNQVEVNCHGGQAAIDRILLSLSAGGLATPTMKAIDEKSYIANECLSMLTQSTTARTVEFILRQLPDRLERLLVSLIETIDQVEVSMATADLSDEAVAALESSCSRIQRILSWSEFGRHLIEPWRVVLVGCPNVGKSTLINALLGYERAIVFDEPGTTRDVVIGETAFDGWPVRLADTAGIRRTDNELESQGIAKSRQEIVDADCVCVLLDVSDELTTREVELLNAVVEIAGADKSVVVLHKADLMPQWHRAAIPEPLRDRCVSVSSVSGDGVESLMQRIVHLLVPETPTDDDIVPLSRRQVACLERARNSLSPQSVEISEAQQALRQCLNGDDV